MASSGKKGKKSKGTVISLQSFLSNGETQVGTTQVSKKIRNVDGDDSDDGGNTLPLVYQLPTAPRANRIFDDDSIPHKPPYIAYVTNLPFDANEDDIYSFFGSIPLASLRLPREDGETGRVRGFGYIEFESRDDLIHVLSMPDPTIKGRRIRVELSNEQEQQNARQRGSRRGFEGFGNSGENRDSTNWRRDNQAQESGGFSSMSDRSNHRERKFYSEDNDAPGSWRAGNRSLQRDTSPRTERNKDFNPRTRNFDREERNTEGTHSLERPKLNLKPRTLPLPEIISNPEAGLLEEEETSKILKATGIASEKVFGSAKPVDTASRELEIEERLKETRRQEKVKWNQEEIVEQLADTHIEKKDKETANTAISWRRRNDSDSSGNNEIRKCSPERVVDTRSGTTFIPAP